MRRPTNDNEGDVYGIDPHGDLFEKWRVADAAKQIEADLENYLQSGSDKLGRILARGEAYGKGLTNGETVLAVISALSNVQLKFVGKLTAMHFGVGAEDEE